MKSQVCDGLDDCPDRSDEWTCLQLHNDTMKLQIRSADNEWHPVCSDGWNSTLSDMACQNLGYSKATFTAFPSGPEENPDSTNVSYYILKENILSSRLTASLEPANTAGICTSNSLLEISCQDFSKFYTRIPQN